MKWIFIILFSLFGIIFLVKGIELWAIMGQVDQNGIDISFFGIEIIETVPKENVPGYALGFTVAALIPIFVAINIGIKVGLTNQNKQYEI